MLRMACGHVLLDLLLGRLAAIERYARFLNLSGFVVRGTIVVHFVGQGGAARRDLGLYLTGHRRAALIPGSACIRSYAHRGRREPPDVRPPLRHRGKDHTEVATAGPPAKAA